MWQYAAYISIQVCQYLLYFTHTEKNSFFLTYLMQKICMHKVNVFLISEPHCLACNMTDSNIIRNVLVSHTSQRFTLQH